MNALGRSRAYPWFVVALAATALVLANDPRSRALAAGTLLLSTAVAAASVTLGTPLAFVLLRTNALARHAQLVLLLALLFTPLYLQAAAWQAGFGLQGWISNLVGGPPLLDGWRGAMMVHTLAAIPWVVAIVGVGLRLAEPELEEDALLDGTPAQVFWHVTLRRAANSLVAAFLWVAITVSGEMTVTDLFAVRTYAEQIYTEIALGDNLDTTPWNVFPSLLAGAWICIASLALVSRLMPGDRFASVRAVAPLSLRRMRLPVSIASIVAVALLVGVPLASLVARAGMLVARESGALQRRWSAAKVFEIVWGSPRNFSREIYWSLVIGALAASAALVVALPLAWQARRAGGRGVAVWLLVSLCLALPGPLIGLALIKCFNAVDWPVLVQLYDQSVVPTVIAQAIRAVPVCVLVVWYAIRGVPKEHFESAAIDGATPGVIFFRVVLPQCRGALAVAWLAALAIAWGELSASILVEPPGVTTLAIRVFGLIHYGVDDRVAGITLVTMLGFLVLALAATRLARKITRLA